MILIRLYLNTDVLNKNINGNTVKEIKVIYLFKNGIPLTIVLELEGNKKINIKKIK